ncbi:ankyrin repeat domain-containing protein [Wolbachia endosymbiont (group A) of Myopa testacea]|uniref:ankyrin repeat domain-containing protein n=1 Tax=Wolbachia endosymbiont (group A) of Myopa testacea TaxID=3066148 RepID=UPI00333FC171
MTMSNNEWRKVLIDLNAYTDYCKNNIITKIQERLQSYPEYTEWKQDNFNVNHKFTVFDKTLLYLAVKNDCLVLVNILLGIEGINVNVVNKYNGYTPLHLACANNQTGVVNLLLKREDLDVNAIDKDKHTPLHLAVEKGHIGVVNNLLEVGADVNVEDENGKTPLHTAVQFGCGEGIKVLIGKVMIEALIKAGAKVNAENKDKHTPLYFALDKEMVRTLMVLGADVNAKGNHEETPLHIAARNGHIEIVKTLILSEADVDAEDESKRTPLHFAKGKEIVKTLIGAGANVNAEDKDGSTPLHFTGNREKVKVLVEAGANVNAKDKDGSTPLHLAARCYNKEVIEALIEEKRADPLLKDNDNNIPSNFDKNHYIIRHMNFLLSEERMKRHYQQDKIFLVAFSLTILFGTAITITLFATGTITAGLYPVIGAVVTVVAAALAVVYTTVRMLEPSTKMDETKEAQNVNGNVLGGGKAAA